MTNEYLDQKWAEIEARMRRFELTASPQDKMMLDSMARKIFEGANKNVCAWVACEDVEVRDRGKVIPPPVNGMTQYKYNPRKNPHWSTDTNPNMDGKKFSVMMTHDRKIYA